MSTPIMSECEFSNQALASTANTLYLDEKTADVHFILQSEQVPAHKILLIAVSKVFRAMFNGQWKEKNRVPIPEVSAVDFKIFLQYFYFNKVKLSMDNVEGVMNLGNQYAIDACLNDCATLLGYNLTVHNVCWIYRLAILHSHEDLKTECETFIALNTKDVLKSTGFLKCDREILSYILRFDSMTCSETDVFNACMAWVKAVSKRNDLNKELVRIHLGNAFYDIRFGSMEMEKFNAIYKDHEYLFSTDEEKGIQNMIKLEKKQWKSFNGVCRLNPWNKKAVLECNRASGDLKKYCIDETQAITFSVNKTLLLKAIVFSNSIVFTDRFYNNYHEEEFVSDLTIVEIDLLNADFRVIHEDNRVTMERDVRIIQLKKPIIIRRNFKYEIHLKLNMDVYDGDRETMYGNSFVLSTELEMNPGITVKFDSGCVVNGKNRGLIEGIKFIKV